MARGDNFRRPDGVVQIDFGGKKRLSAKQDGEPNRHVGITREQQMEGERLIANLEILVDFYFPGRIPLFDTDGNITFPMRVTEWSEEKLEIYDRVQRKIRESVQNKTFVIPEKYRE